MSVMGTGASPPSPPTATPISLRLSNRTIIHCIQTPGGRAINRCGGRSAEVAAAVQDGALAARQKLLEVALGDLIEVEPRLGGELGHVPQHVAELGGQRLAALLG